jgi:hypothetical protein
MPAASERTTPHEHDGSGVALRDFHDCPHHAHMKALKLRVIRAADARDVGDHAVTPKVEPREHRQAIEQFPQVACDRVRHVTEVRRLAVRGPL